MELEVEDVGPALRYATAKVSKVSREGASSSNAQSTSSQPATNEDPWATPDSGWGTNDEAPF